MNRIVLIGNGFDLAHGLKTRYEDFINWYWDERLHNITTEQTFVSEDGLCSLKILAESGFESWFSFSYHNSFFKDPYKNDWRISGKDFIEKIKKQPDYFDINYSPFFERIIKGIETKGWVDIENEYYEMLKKYSIKDPSDVNINNLNKQLLFLQTKLVEYLTYINSQDIELNSKIKNKIYAPIKSADISNERQEKLKEYIDWCMQQETDFWRTKMKKYGDNLSYADVEEYKKNNLRVNTTDYPIPFMLPDDIMLLSFNYTKTAKLYYNPEFKLNYIHGRVETPESIIFGYGDEIDGNYKIIQNLNNNNFLNNIKTIKYLESDKYKQMLTFIESAPFQVCIMGHSCGNSDRTLLNTLFEHKNCISIKPYYYVKEDRTDSYLELVQNISRNFTDMKLMRDRVVNKVYCATLT